MIEKYKKATGWEEYHLELCVINGEGVANIG